MKNKIDTNPALPLSGVVQPRGTENEILSAPIVLLVLEVEIPFYWRSFLAEVLLKQKIRFKYQHISCTGTRTSTNFGAMALDLCL